MTTSAGLRERGKRRRRERILDAAAELLREQPDQPLTVERIAERAEVAVTTVFNLVGTRDHIWAGVAERAFAGLSESPAAQAQDPQDRARAIVNAVIKRVVDDTLFRAVFRGWDQSANVLEHDLIGDVLYACLRDAGFDRVHIGRLSALTAAGLVGACHQWAAGLIGDRQLRMRARDLVDLAFVAARAANDDPNARWGLNK
jgi:AcrR family transcriptional regulator